jgi:eukaryotic-like serine/threonine-protein kinase
MAESLPERIGPHRVVEALQSGAGITRYLAREQGDTGRDVVLEVIASPPADDAHAALRTREAAACVKLDHPAIVRTLGFFDHDSHMVIVRERFDGMSLSALLASLAGKKDKLPDEAIGHVLVSVLEALAYAHGLSDENGSPAPVVHGAVNPDNVLVARDGTVRVGGFGLTKILNDPSDPMACLRGDLKYLAPEQAGGEEGNATVDVYCVALIAWHLLTGGSVLADAPSGSQMKGGLWLVAERKLASLSSMRGDLPQELSVALDTALQLAPDKRNVSCADLSRLIKDAIKLGAGKQALSDKTGAVGPTSTAGSVEFAVPPPAAARPAPPRPAPPRPASFAPIFVLAPEPEAKAEPAVEAPVPEAKAEPAVEAPVPEAKAEPAVEAPAPEAKAEPVVEAPAPEAKAKPAVEASVPEAKPEAPPEKPPEPAAVAALVPEDDAPVVPMSPAMGAASGYVAGHKRSAIGVALVLIVGGAAFGAVRGGWLRTLVPAPPPVPATPQAAPISQAEPQAPVSAAAPASALAPPPVAPSASAAPPASAAASAIATPAASASPAPSASAHAIVPGLGPNVGRLTVRSTASGAAVYVNMTKTGAPGIAMDVPCGRRFVSIGTPKGKGQDPTWLAPSQNVTIPCGAAIEITMNPKPIK